MAKKILITVIVFGFVIGGIWALNITCPVCQGSRTQECDNCHGDGYVPHPNNSDFLVGCETCGGSGTKHIPSGSERGYREGRGVVPCGACDGRGYQTVPDNSDD